MDKEYIGWIPCLAGDMFFKFTDPGLGEYDIITINYLTRSNLDEATKRYIVVSSVFDWKDSGDPAENGVFRIIVYGSSDSKTHLEGSVFLISEVTQPGSNLPNPTNSPEERLIRCLRNQEKVIKIAVEAAHCGKFEEAQDLNESYPTFIEDVRKLIIEASATKYVFKIDFSLNAAGFIKLNAVSDDAGIINVTDPTQRRTITRQAFYYLKYLFHKHQHHHHTNDSLTRIHRIEPIKAKVADTLIRDLKCGLVDVKRNHRFERKEIAGIAAYGKSLVYSCDKEGYFDSLGENRNSYKNTQLGYFDNLAESIRLLGRQHISMREKCRAIIDSSQKIIAAVFLFFTPIILISLRYRSPTTNQGDHGYIYEYYFLNKIIEGNIYAIFGAYLMISVFALCVSVALNENPIFLKRLWGWFTRSYLPYASYSFRSNYDIYGHIVWFVNKSIVRIRRNMLQLNEYELRRRVRPHRKQSSKFWLWFELKIKETFLLFIILAFIVFSVLMIWVGVAIFLKRLNVISAEPNIFNFIQLFTP